MLGLLGNKFLAAGLSGLFLAVWPVSCFNDNGAQTLLTVKSQNWYYLDDLLISKVGRPGDSIDGVELAPLGPTVGDLTNFGPLTTDDNGEVNVYYATLDASWSLGVSLNPYCLDNVHYNPPMAVASQVTSVDLYPDSNNYAEHTFHCDLIKVPEPEDVNPGFSTNASHPGTITVASTQALTSTYGMPMLRIYGNDNAGPVVVETATSISSDGMHATFPYPLVNGQVLPPDLYSWVLINQGPSGHELAGNDFMAIGKADTTDYSDPFGVAALTFAQSGQSCRLEAGNPERVVCTPQPSILEHYPIVTEYDMGQVKFNGNTMDVGSNPTVVRAYNVTTNRENIGSFGGYISTTQAQDAIITNTGSNTVSVLDLPTKTTVATIPVGTEPVDVQVSPDNSTAYVVNYASKTLSVISLASNTVTNTVSLPGSPTSISLDDNGHAWIGGVGFIDEVNLSNLSVVSSKQTSDTITGLAFSSGQNQLLTSIAPTSTSTLTGAFFKPSSSYTQSATISGSGAYSDYQNSILGSQLTLPSELSTGVLISSKMNNLFGVTASGSNINVVELYTGKTLLTGEAPGVIRGMAVGADDGVVYLTVPSSNEVISVDIPAPPVADPSATQD